MTTFFTNIKTVYNFTNTTPCEKSVDRLLIAKNRVFVYLSGDNSSNKKQVEF